MSTELRDKVAVQYARKVFGFAVSHDPFEVYASCGNPLPSRMAKQVTNWILHQFQEHSPKSLDDDTAYLRRLGVDASLLQYGIDDTQTFLSPFLRRKSAAEARKFVASEHVCDIMAALALRGDDDEIGGMRAIADITSDAYRYITDSSNHINPQLRALPPSPDKGCPFAGASGKIDISPLFRRFIPWAGSLAIAAIEAHNLGDKSLITPESLNLEV